MNNDFEKEIFTQKELEKLNLKLKNTENLKTPESLSEEKMAEKLSEISSFVPEIKPVNRKRRKRVLYSAVAMAASFAIIVSSLLLFKPWEKDPVKPVAPQNDGVKVSDYTEIEELFAEYADKYKTLTAQNKVYNYFSNWKGNAIVEDAASSDMAAPNSSASNTSQKPTASVTNQASTSREESHGETNEQVKGVNEADIIKNDGKYLYVLNPDNADWEGYYNQFYGSDGKVVTTFSTNEVTTEKEKPSNEKTTEDRIVLDYTCSVSIIEPLSDGTLKKVGVVNILPKSTMELDIFYMIVQEMYVKGDKLIALIRCELNNPTKYVPGSYNYVAPDAKVAVSDCYHGVNTTDFITMAVCFDISDKANAKEEWRIYQDGEYISSRLIGDRLVTLSNDYIDISAEKEDVITNCVPKAGTSPDTFSRIASDDICIMEEIRDTSYLVATTVDINDKNTMKSEACLGAGSEVYCTADTLYAVSPKTVGIKFGEIIGNQEIEYTEKTQIYKFDISYGDIKFKKSGCVDGYALNQFSMDEYKGYLRIATTKGNWKDAENAVYVLDSELNVVGSVENIAKGETIKSVRFTGDTGYVVTFEQTDPLFVIDLKNPQKPEIKGELKIPGFSSYLHPVGDGLVLGVGVDGDESGQREGMKISLFDVSDPTKPVEADKIVMSGMAQNDMWSYVSSEAFYNHKALCYNSDENIMYIPYRKITTVIAYTEGRTAYDYYTSGILAVRVDAENKKLVSDGDYVVKDDDTFLDGYNRATYIGDIIIGYSKYDSIMSSFNKTTQMELDRVKI